MFLKSHHREHSSFGRTWRVTTTKARCTPTKGKCCVVVLQVSALTFSLLTTISCSGLRQESLIDIDGPEEDEDMIYECPGLAPHGEMEVTNPFFLQREFNLHTDTETEAEVDAEVSEAATPAQAATSAPPCPVNTSTTISHGTIARTQH